MTTDYKDTLNLPRTGFAMKAGLAESEPKRLQHWESQSLYGQIQAASAGKTKFVLHDGPPFANGDVHIGTALNKILKDVIVKYKSLRGFHAPYIPGWDCHGLPIEFKVSQEMRKAGNTSADAATIRTACEAYARKYIDLQRTQFKRLGVLGDWENPYLTLNKSYEAEELRLFSDIVAKGFVYRGKKPVYWSIPCRTALAEAEVEYADHISQSIFVKFRIDVEKSAPETRSLIPANAYVVIWTTTPWTLPANLAVAFNSNLNYCFVENPTENGTEHLLVASALAQNLVEKAGLANAKISPNHFVGSSFLGLSYEHPFIKRFGKLYAGDSFVTADTGTGFVHIAPGHGLDDYNLGRQNGLPIYSPVNDDGAFAYSNELPEDQQMPPDMLGKSILAKNGRSEANESVLDELRKRNALLKLEDYKHSYPHCWRSKTPIIFRAMDQWFIRIDHENFRQSALAEIDRVQWVPDWGVNRIKGAVESRPDWCISRQRTWGVPIPAFYDAKNEPILDAQIVRNVADLIEQHGSNVWFEKTVNELWPLVRPKDWQGTEAANKSMDTLDVWIDSGSSSRAVIARREEIRGVEKPFQADIYLEGSDQHRGWFQSSLLLSLAGNGAAPFKTVLTHGFMVDADREKISKSKQGQGGYDKPQTAEAYVKKYGADVVRLWVASQDYRNDIVVSEERLNTVGETYRHLRNTIRYQLSNLYDFDPAQHTVSDDQLTALDRWVLAEFSKLESEVAAAYDRYEFHVVYQKLSQFAAVELSSLYHDAVKDRLYTDAANSVRRRSTQTALWRMVRGLCQMLSPMLVFTADEAWESIPGSGKTSVHLTTWEPKSLVLTEREQLVWKQIFEIRPIAMACLEKERQAKNIGKALDAKVILRGSPQALGNLTGAEQESLRELLNVSQLVIDATAEVASVTAEAVKASGQKCERCWHWEMDVGASTEHPTLCGRCMTAVRTFM